MSRSGYSGQLILQHNDFSNQYSGSFQELRENKELLDVTLACEVYTIDVHKVVLAARSRFFRNVLSKTNQIHPFIYLKGIKFEDLKTILDYIYNGEATINSDLIDRFLEAAKELQIKGLAPDEDNLNDTDGKLKDLERPTDNPQEKDKSNNINPIEEKLDNYEESKEITPIDDLQEEGKLNDLTTKIKETCNPNEETIAAKIGQVNETENRIHKKSKKVEFSETVLGAEQNGSLSVKTEDLLTVMELSSEPA